MKKRKAAPRPAKKKRTVAKGPKPRKRPARAVKKKTRKAKPAAAPAEPEIRRAIPLDYVTTEELSLRRAPGSVAEILAGGALAKGTLVRIAPQEWWYVELAGAPATGAVRGWVPGASLRRATEEEERRSAPPAPPPPTTPLPSPETRLKIATSILNFEARRDSNGHLRVYNLPPRDGGGRYEVAGINERYDPEEAAKLRDMLNAGQYDAAEREAAEYIAQYTDVVAKWTTVPSIEAYLRDCAFNRGPGGAAKILQMALSVTVDGGVGPETLGALRTAEKNPAKLLAAMRVAREQYELRVVGRREEFWKGLINRWDNSLAFARGMA